MLYDWQERLDIEFRLAAFCLLLEKFLHSRAAGWTADDVTVHGRAQGPI
jgi:hypothetical protein